MVCVSNWNSGEMLMGVADGLKERPAIREHILGLQELPNVIITTYGIAKIKDDNKFLRRLKPSVSFI